MPTLVRIATSVLIVLITASMLYTAGPYRFWIREVLVAPNQAYAAKVAVGLWVIGWLGSGGALIAMARGLRIASSNYLKVGAYLGLSSAALTLCGHVLLAGRDFWPDNPRQITEAVLFSVKVVLFGTLLTAVDRRKGM